MVGEVGARDVVAAAEAVVTMLEGAPTQAARWNQRAGTLRWSCRRTAAHVADAALWYAANLARRSTADAEVPLTDPKLAPARLVDNLRSASAILAAVVSRARASDRGYHSWGITDRSGFAAMGCDELLLHGYDLAVGLGRAGEPLPFDPPVATVRRVVARLFPWAPPDADPWAALLWANGRAPLGDRPPETHWLWHNAPVAEWDGTVRRWKPRSRPST